jgi:hypothetical protein
LPRRPPPVEPRTAPRIRYTPWKQPSCRDWFSSVTLTEAIIAVLHEPPEKEKTHRHTS